MLLKDEVQLLRHVPFFQRVDPCKLKLLAFASHRVSYNQGETLFEQGDGGDAAYVIIGGKVDLMAHSPAGDIKIGDAGANSIIGEMALLCDGPRTATARAATDVEALRISKDCLSKVMADNPRVSFEISRALAERLRVATSELDNNRIRQAALAD
ncbi:cyclic nucleotide-binding domain-containing protein [Rhizobium paknamense]|uniref:CRP-like cAMP-binding protein n=1 Tax=Rhizobium paknamense TaxID=1206817 RepID=A0ABU0ID51_9HYPH|nr:Crp/Fnr family transcriptional regulator [Rhizobium paknamense]MDQ0456116.1 CRP-like cAMP-binding protein [Rhizobium paknamense]